MLKWLGYISLMLLLMALITSPTEKEWKSYVYATVNKNCKPVIQYHSYKIAWFPLFSVTSVRDCEVEASIASHSNARREQKYLGLFGTFWRL